MDLVLKCIHIKNVLSYKIKRKRNKLQNVLYQSCVTIPRTQTCYVPVCFLLWYLFMLFSSHFLVNSGAVFLCLSPWSSSMSKWWWWCQCQHPPSDPNHIATGPLQGSLPRHNAPVLHDCDTTLYLNDGNGSGDTLIEYALIVLHAYDVTARTLWNGLCRATCTNCIRVFYISPRESAPQRVSLSVQSNAHQIRMMPIIQTWILLILVWIHDRPRWGTRRRNQWIWSYPLTL